MNKLLVLAVVASLVACTTAQCGEAVEQCLQTFLGNLGSYSNQDQACVGFKTYVSCVEDACGDLPSETLQQIQNTLNERGFQCSISGTAAPSISLLLVPIMAALPAVIWKLW